MRAFSLVPLLLLAACSFGFESSSDVTDLRVLAVSAEPAELVAGAPLPASVTVSALVVDPREPGRVVPYEWRACIPGFSNGANEDRPTGPPIPSGGLDTTTDPRCDETDDTNRVAAGTSALEDVSITVPVPESLSQAVQGAAAQGLPLSLYVNAQLRLDDEGSPLYALKRVPVSPPVPVGRVANENPKLVALLFDGEVWDPATPLKVKYGACDPSEKRAAVDRTRPGEEVSVCAHKVTPVFDEEEAQTFLVRTFDGRDLEQKERLRFAWFVEHGSLEFGETGQPTGIGPQRYDPVSTTWFEPPEKPASAATLWIVVRDGRGGVSWERRAVLFE